MAYHGQNINKKKNKDNQFVCVSLIAIEFDIVVTTKI